MIEKTIPESFHRETNRIIKLEIRAGLLKIPVFLHKKKLGQYIFLWIYFLLHYYNNL